MTPSRHRTIPDLGLAQPHVMALALLSAAACSAPRLRPLPEPRWSQGVASSTAHVEVNLEAPLDLHTLLRLAGTRPLAIEVARAQAQAAAADETRALSRFVPSLRPQLAFFRHQRRLQNTQGAFLDVDKQNTFGGAGLDLQVNVADAWYDHLAAQQRARASTLGVDTAQHINLGRAVQLYYALVQAQASLQIAAQAQAHAEHLVALKEARAAVGDTLRSDVLRAQAFLAATQGKQAGLQARAAGLGAQLAALLLLPDGTQLIPAEPRIAPIEFPEAALEPAQLLERALCNRPDLEGALALARAAEAEHGRAAYGWLLPELRVGADFGGFGATPSKFEQQEQYHASIAWQVEFGGMAAAQAADARRHEAELRVEMLRRHIRSELLGASAELESTRARIRAARREAQAAAAALELVRARHEADAILLVEVLDAERATTEARTNLVGAICEHNRAQFELRRLVGGPNDQR